MALEMTMMSMFQLFDLYWIGCIGPAALARWAGLGTTGVWISLGLVNLSNGLAMAFWFR